MKKLLVIVILTSSILAGYTESDKYAYDFYLPEKYIKERVDNEFGPFYQFRHPDAWLFVHFWARPRPRGADTAFLKNAYEVDFMKGFVDGEDLSSKRLDRGRLSGASAYRYEVTLLQQYYTAEIYYAMKGRLFYTLAFYYRKDQKELVETDISTAVYSFQYGF